MTYSFLPIQATAALVMQWGYPAFSGRSKDFADALDLTAARDLIVACEKICPWYGEVIVNRKAAIKILAIQSIKGSDKPVTVLIPAAGWSPLALDLIAVNPDTAHVVEFDIASMTEKKALYDEIAPDISSNIKCIEADISNPELLLAYIPVSTENLLIILEGITYFMQAEWVRQMVETFSKKNNPLFIIEYLLPEEEINAAGRIIADTVFSIVTNTCKCPPPIRYSPRNLTDIAITYGYHNVRTFTTTEMEYIRTGTNQYFQDKSDGWIAITCMK
jgi:hypothetical protein